MSNGLMMPEIIKETSSGYVRETIPESMFRNREIMCIGEITEELANSLILQFRYLDRESPEQEITMYINSPGGEVSGGLALYDVMQAASCPVRTVCMGTAASMAAILFLAGKRRGMLPHANVMIHDPLVKNPAGASALAMERISRNLMKTREIIAGIIAEHTGRSMEEVYEKTMQDSFFDAKESIAWGLADEIITKI